MRLGGKRKRALRGTRIAVYFYRGSVPRRRNVGKRNEEPRKEFAKW